MKRRCAVYDCKFQDDRVFYFPRTLACAEKWREACGNPALNHIPVERLNKMRVVCKRHFSWDQFVHPLRDRLNRGAVPHLFLPLNDGEDELRGSEVNTPLIPSVLQHVIFPPIDIAGALELVATSDGPENHSDTREIEEDFLSEDMPSPESRALSPSEMLREIVERTPAHALESTANEIPKPESPMAQSHEDEGKTSDLVFMGPGISKTPSTLVSPVNFRQCLEVGEPSMLPSSTAEVAQPDSPIPSINGYYRYYLCRLCFSSREHMTNVFEEEDMCGFVITDAIEDLLDFKVSKTDDYPQFVCSGCLTMLIEYKDFKDRVLKKKQAFDELLKKQRMNSHEDNSDVLAVSNVDSSPIYEELGNLHGTNQLEFSSGIEDISEIKAGESVVEFDEMYKTDKENESTSCGEYLEEDMGSNEGNAETDEAISDVEESSSKNVPEIETYKKRFPEIYADEFRCKECGEVFRYLNHLRKHSEEHLKTKPVPCQYCDKRFSSLSDLNSHIIVHSDYRPFECEHCGLRCRTKLNLLHHKLVHSSEKPFLCSTCGMSFRNEFLLNSHARQHSDIKQYVCDECGKEFKTSRNLRSHAGVHIKNCPFTCTECGKAYKTVASLRNHIKHMHLREGKKRKSRLMSAISDLA